MLPRVLEPEVMDTPEEARDYDAMDHAEVNARFCDDLLALGPVRLVLDVGTGTAQIPVALCARAPEAQIVAIDLAEHMLALGRENVARAGLTARIRLERLDAKALPYEDGAFETVVSNSIVHHIPSPEAVLREMWRVTAPGGRLFVRDLHRPGTEPEVDRLVSLYGGVRPSAEELVASFDHQLSLFRSSLHAALTVDEVREVIAPLGIAASAVTMTSDRHWTLSCVKT